MIFVAVVCVNISNIFIGGVLHARLHRDGPKDTDDFSSPKAKYLPKLYGKTRRGEQNQEQPDTPTTKKAMKKSTRKPALPNRWSPSLTRDTRCTANSTKAN